MQEWFVDNALLMKDVIIHSLIDTQTVSISCKHARFMHHGQCRQYIIARRYIWRKIGVCHRMLGTDALLKSLFISPLKPSPHIFK